MLKIAHFCISSHIGGVGGGLKTYGPQNMVGPWSMVAKIADLGPPGPHNNFFRKKSPYINNLSLDHKGRTAPPKRMNFRKNSKGGIISNPNIYIADFGPLNRAFSA